MQPDPSPLQAEFHCDARSLSVWSAATVECVGSCPEARPALTPEAIVSTPFVPRQRLLPRRMDPTSRVGSGCALALTIVGPIVDGLLSLTLPLDTGGCSIGRRALIRFSQQRSRPNNPTQLALRLPRCRPRACWEAVARAAAPLRLRAGRGGGLGGGGQLRAEAPGVPAISRACRKVGSRAVPIQAGSCNGLRICGSALDAVKALGRRILEGVSLRPHAIGRVGGRRTAVFARCRSVLSVIPCEFVRMKFVARFESVVSEQPQPNSIAQILTCNPGSQTTTRIEMPRCYTDHVLCRQVRFSRFDNCHD